MDEALVKLISEWTTLEAQLGPLKAKEMELRKQIATALFKAPKEGTNYADLNKGWRLKLVHKLGYKLDMEQAPIVAQQLQSIGVDLGTLIKTKYELGTTAYKALSDSTRAVVDQMITITPQSPALELVPPKESK